MRGGLLRLEIQTDQPTVAGRICERDWDGLSGSLQGGAGVKRKSRHRHLRIQLTTAFDCLRHADY